MLYEKEKKTKCGSEAYRHISEILDEAKELHKKDWLKKPTPNNDHEQSCRAFKGNNLEKLMAYILNDEVATLGLKIVSGKTFEEQERQFFA